MPEEKLPETPLPPPDPARTREALEAAEEYVEELRAVLEKLRKKLN